jgi:hypothetical protein
MALLAQGRKRLDGQTLFDILIPRAVSVSPGCCECRSKTAFHALWTAMEEYSQAQSHASEPYNQCEISADPGLRE